MNDTLDDLITAVQDAGEVLNNFDAPPFAIICADSDLKRILYEVDSLRDETGMFPIEYEHAMRRVWTNEWCPSGIVFLPMTKEEADAVMAVLLAVVPWLHKNI